MDDIAELTNKTLGKLLFIHCIYGKWVKTSPLLALLYKTTPQSYTIQSPYIITIAKQPALLVKLTLRDLKVPSVSDFLWDISRL